MENPTNLGVQLMPLILIIAAVAFKALGSGVYAMACMILAVMFYLVLTVDNKK